MRGEYIEIMIKSGQLRMRHIDRERVKSIIKSSVKTVAVVKNMQLTEENATVVFREIYESIRQLGDAKWWLLGYEPLNHDVSLEILKEMDIRDKVKINHLARFRKIRNDANYRGFHIRTDQAKEIIDFWETCGKNIANVLSKHAEW